MRDRLATLTSLTGTIKRYELAAKKSLGQHFLLDGNLLDKIVRVSRVKPESHVLEVGPGPGGLTRALLGAGVSRLIAIEKDTRAVQALQEVKAIAPHLTLIEADALEYDEASLVTENRRIEIVANLPYNIGTALLLKWLRMPSVISTMTLMLQKEVAERIVATPSTADYGRLSVLCQVLAECELVFDVPREAFVPPPKVTSSIVQVTLRDKPAYDVHVESLELVTHHSFTKRRKMLRGSLKSLVEDPEKLLADAGIEPTRRPEELSIEEFCRLANCYHHTAAG